MPIGAAREVLSKHGICQFSEGASRALNSYLKRFPEADDFERSIRENIVSAAAAELACLWFRLRCLRDLLSLSLSLVEPLRRLWSLGWFEDVLWPLRAPRRVGTRALETAIEVADTASTVECYTAQAARDGTFQVADLFLFSGDGIKAQRAIVEMEEWRKWEAAKLAQAFLQEFERLHREWRPGRGAESELVSLMNGLRYLVVGYFACLRFCALRDLDTETALRQMNEVRSVLGERAHHFVVPEP